MTPPPMLYVAGNPERLARLPKLLRLLLTHGTSDRCGCAVAYHGLTRDRMAYAAQQAGRRLVVLCGDCGRIVADDGDAAWVPVDCHTLAKDIRRLQAERQ